MMRLWYCALTVVIAVLTLGCNRSDARSVSNPNTWSDSTGVYHIADKGLEYVIGNDSAWIVVDPMQLPDGFEMCVVDESTGVCVFVVDMSRLTDCDKNIMDYSENELYDNLYAMFHREGRKEVIKGGTTERTNYLDDDAWGFATVVAVADGDISGDVAYRGYMFDCDGKPCVIVAVCNGNNPPDNSDDMQYYFSRLRRVPTA